MKRPLVAAVILSIAAAVPLLAAGKPSLNVYFQKTLTDTAYPSVEVHFHFALAK